MNRKTKFLLKKYIKDGIGIILGTAIMAFATAQFLLPNQLSSGGFSGIGTIFYYLFNIPLGTIIFLLNMPFFILAYIKIGKTFLVKAIAGTVSLSFFVDIFSNFSSLTQDRILACVYGGILMGLGTAITFKSRASTGGTDLVTQIIREYKPQYKTSNLIVILDIIIVVLNVMFFKQIEIGLYSAITIYLMGKVIDIVFEGIDFTKMIYIVSPKNERISQKINEDIRRGTTGFYAKGMYKNDDKLVLMCVASRAEVIKIMYIARKIDKGAFIIITNAREVYGKGFKK